MEKSITIESEVYETKKLRGTLSSLKPSSETISNPSESIMMVG